MAIMSTQRLALLLWSILVTMVGAACSGEAASVPAESPAMVPTAASEPGPTADLNLPQITGIATQIALSSRGMSDCATLRYVARQFPG